MNLNGIHHVTAVSANARENLRFYTQTLGMRLVKRSVNQDDTSAYHLFYADAKGSPGSDLTFFNWRVPSERHGTRSITRTHLRVAGEEALQWWAQRLREQAVPSQDIILRDGRLTLDFTDREGQRLSLVDDGGAGDAHPWERSPVPAAYQVRGLGPILLSVPNLRPTDYILRTALNMLPLRTYPHPDNPKHTVHVYSMSEGRPGENRPQAEVHVAVQPDLAITSPGSGGVHHVAFRTPTYKEHNAWIERINELRIPNSGLVDRFYFHSLYFREPNGILFEIASDEPGFAVDEDETTLGEKLALPPFLEPRRAEIVAGLEPLEIPA